MRAKHVLARLSRHLHEWRFEDNPTNLILSTRHTCGSMTVGTMIIGRESRIEHEIIMQGASSRAPFGCARAGH